MGTSFTALVGNPPDIVTDYAGWLDWYQRLLAFRLAECPLVRGVTYYFSQAGNDSTGNGSQGQPWKTIAKAQAQITAAASNANLRLRFRRGDTWEETAGLNLNKANITVDAYGTGAKPLFNRFTVKYAASGWTVATGDRYTRTEANDIAWVRDASDRLGIVYKRVSTTADVESTPLSFYWASNTLHINVGAGVNANTKNLEAVVSNSNSGVSVSGDGCRVDGIRADGWGCHRTTTATQAQPFTASCSGTNACLFVDCEGYYSGSHVMAHYNGGTGGITTWIRCRAGYAKFNLAGETIFNYFAANGGNEALEVDCITEYGTLPSSDWGNANVIRRGQACFAHTNGNSVGLVVSLNHLMRDNPWGVTAPPSFGNSPAASTLSDARLFVVGAMCEGGLSSGVGFWWSGSAGGVAYGCNYKFNVYPQGIESMAGAHPVGWVINCLFDIDTRNANNRYAAWNGSSTTVPAVKMYNCAWIVRTGSGKTFLLDYDAQDNINVVIKGCLFVNAGDGTFSLGGHNAPGSLDYCACYGVTVSGNTGYNNGIANITLETSILANELRSLDAASPLYQAGDASLGLSHDMLGNRRKVLTPSIGPVDAYAGQLVPDVTHVRKGTLYDGSNKTGVLLPIMRRMQGS